MPARQPDDAGIRQGDTEHALQELLKSTKQAEYEARHNHYCSPVAEEPLMVVPGYPADGPAGASFSPLDTASLRSNLRGGPPQDGALKLSGRRHDPTSAGRAPPIARSPLRQTDPPIAPMARHPASSSSRANGQHSGFSSSGSRSSGYAAPVARSVGGTEIGKLQAELADWQNELRRKEAELACSDNPESIEEVERLQTEVGMQAEQLRTIVGLLRHGLREADAPKIPRLIEADEEAEEAEEDDAASADKQSQATSQGQSTSQSQAAAQNHGNSQNQPSSQEPRKTWPVAPPTVSSESQRRLAAANPMTSKSLSWKDQRSSDPRRLGSPLPMASTRSPLPQQFRSLSHRSPPPSSRPPSSREQSMDRAGAEPPPPTDYYRGSSQSRSNLRTASLEAPQPVRTMSPDGSVPALQPPSVAPSVRANAPPRSPDRVLSSRRTLPASMARSNPWFPAASQSAGSSGASASQARVLGKSTAGASGPTAGPGSLQLSANGGVSRPAPSAAQAPMASPVHKPRNSSSSPGPSGLRSSGAAPPGRPAAASSAGTNASAAAAAVGAGPYESQAPRPSVRQAPWQVVSSAPPAVVPRSPGPGQDQRLSAHRAGLTAATLTPQLRYLNGAQAVSRQF